LALTRYSRLAASSRYRLLQFLPMLTEAGFDVTVKELLGDWYVGSLVDGRRPSGSRVIAAYLRRIVTLLRTQAPDLIWIERELLPWLPSTLERILLAGDTPTILDLDDSVFHRYDQHASVLVRKLLGGRVDRAMAAATVVVSGNPTIAARARLSGAGRVVEMPTVVDCTRYPVVPTKLSRGDHFTVGWMGSPQNSHYLETLREPLTRLAAEGPVRILVIGGVPSTLSGLPVEVRPWSEATEIEALCEMDVGVMPLPDRPFERGKCGLKLLQYMAAWKPAVASPVGINTQLIDHGIRGFLADGPDEWLAALRRLRDDVALYRSMAAAGRHMVERDYSVASVGPRLVDLMQELTSARRPVAALPLRAQPDGLKRAPNAPGAVSMPANEIGPAAVRRGAANGLRRPEP
jgi:glycosyltransferase involved in cell wall biosynthesis